MIYRGSMTRIAVVVALVLASSIWVACDVGTVLANSSGDGGSGGSSGPDCPAAQTPVPAHMHLAGGTSNLGMSCISSGCHLTGMTGSAAPVFNYAGTVFNATGSGPAGGINVLITLNGATKKWLTDADGNFYVEDPLQAAPTALMQATVKVCQTPTPMTGTLAAGNGDCNAGGTCHGSVSPIGTEGKITGTM
jgi:hypothetical protein